MQSGSARGEMSSGTLRREVEMVVPDEDSKEADACRIRIM
jgi:hypothetical protein